MEIVKLLIDGIDVECLEIILIYLSCNKLYCGLLDGNFLCLCLLFGLWSLNFFCMCNVFVFVEINLNL